MAVTKPVWSAEQTGFNSTIAASGTGDTNIDLATNGWDVVVGMIDVTLSTAASVTVRLFRSTDGGTDFTNESLAGGFSIDADGVYPFDLYAEDYVRVSILNDDGTNATGTITVTYQGRNWDTT